MTNHISKKYIFNMTLFYLFKNDMINKIQYIVTDNFYLLGDKAHDNMNEHLKYLDAISKTPLKKGK